MPGNTAPFVRKTYEIVCDPTTDEIVRWNETGTSFLILQEHAFQKEVLPKYFKHDNLCSFIRQLNTYGFRKVSGSKDVSTESVLEFEQPDFQRDQPNILSRLKRKQNKKTVPKQELCETSKEDISAIVADRGRIANALSTLMKQQQQTEKTIKLLWEELSEAKKVVTELEAKKRAKLERKNGQQPPQKRPKYVDIKENPLGVPLAQVTPPNVIETASTRPILQSDWISSENESESDVANAARNMTELSGHLPFRSSPQPT